MQLPIRFAVVAAAIMVGMCGRGFAFPTSHDFYTLHGLTEGDIQRLRACMTFVFFLSAPFAGVLIDRLGVRACVAFTAVSFAGSAIGYVAVPGAAVFYACECLVAFGYGLGLSALEVFVYRRQVAAGREQNFSLVWGSLILLETLFWSGSNLVGGYLTWDGDLSRPYYISAATYGLLLVALIVGWKSLGGAGPRVESRLTFGSLAQQILVLRKAWIFFLAFGLIAGAYRVLYFVQPSYFRGAGFSKESAGQFTALIYLAVGCFAFGAHWTKGVMNVRGVLGMVVGVTAVAALCLGAANPGVAWPLFVVPVALRGISRTLFPAVVQRVMPDAIRGSTASTFFLVEGAFATGGLLISGMLIDQFGLNGMCLALGTTLLLLSVVLFVGRVNVRSA